VVTRAADDGAAGAERRGRMRVSDADREGVIHTLKAAYVYGLVTKDEFDDRVSHTLASRTYAELALITGDIPVGLAADLVLPGPAVTKAKLRPRADERPGNRAVGATAVLAALIIIAAFFAPNPLAGLLALGAAGSAAVCLFLAESQVSRSRRDKRSGGQLPPHGGLSTGPSSGQRLQIRQPRRRNPADAALNRSLRPQVST
jgi:hypothetical protein